MLPHLITNHNRLTCCGYTGEVTNYKEIAEFGPYFWLKVICPKCNTETGHSYYDARLGYHWLKGEEYEFDPQNNKWSKIERRSYW